MSRAPSGAVRDLALTVVWFGLLGVVAGVAWWQLAPELVATRTDDAVVLQPDQLPRQVGVDGWYAALGVVGGVVSGTALLAWRRARPVSMVGLVALGGLLAGVLSLQVGAWLGPSDANDVLAAADVGAQAPLDLRLQAPGLLWSWSVAALLGAVVYLVVRGPDKDDDPGRPQGVTESATDDAAPR